MSKKQRFILVRLQSNRGTDATECIEVTDGMTDREAAEQWAEEYTRGTACHEYSVTHRRVRLPTRKQLLAKWNPACDRFESAKKRRDELRAMLLARAVVEGRRCNSA